jgi:acyl transferase domain-containing protein
MKSREPLAIVGIGCRFPGSVRSPAELWKLLVEGVDAITEIPANRWSLASFYDPDPAKPGRACVRWGGFLEGVDEFDAQFFGISPREAARADPQQRLLLEVAYEALEDAGISQERIAGSTGGVFVGISSYDYGGMQYREHERLGIDAYTNLGAALCIAANRISYLFDLHGPSLAVDTACSSSLVAAHLACQSIWERKCEFAFVAGVNLILRPEVTIGFSKASMLAPDGHCKSFDARANGYVRGEGCGVLVVKPLSRALEDHDTIYAVIRATVVNQDGRTEGISVPNEEAQEAMLREALYEAGISAHGIQYVEAHGTGTPVGDPIEARALGRVLGKPRAPGSHCLIGSIKSNIGHLESASGIAGLIKAALCLKHGQIPRSLHSKRLIPKFPSIICVCV